jgi:glutathione S-transferase
VALELHQFASSHFNEKARWALDYKAIPHRRISYLPGPHMPAIKKLTNGNTTTTPVLVAGETVQGSANIIAYLEEHYPEPPLYPSEPGSALDWQSRLDAELGPAVRTVVFAVLVNEPGFLTLTFARDKPWYKQTAFRAMLPLLLPIIKKANGADSEENIQHCQGVVDDYLNEIARVTAATGYLVGDNFTVADLTAAALLAPLAKLNHEDMRRPTPMPQAMTALINAYAEHPTLQWVHRMYDQHRPR